MWRAPCDVILGTPASSDSFAYQRLSELFGKMLGRLSVDHFSGVVDSIGAQVFFANDIVALLIDGCRSFETTP